MATPARSPVGEWQDEQFRALEILLAGFDVAGLKIGNIHAATATGVRIGLPLLIMKECDQPGEFLRGNFEGRHALIRTSIADDGTDLVSRYVAGNQFGAGEIGAGFAASGVATVTEGAVLGKERLAALDYCR